MALTAMWLGGMVVTIAVVLASALLADDLRIVVWAVVVAGWVGVMLLFGVAPPSGTGAVLAAPTDSIVERFGLFTIIVLGEVVVGVVDGMGEVELDAATMVTGFLALVVGFGLWWLYFDGAGRRLPRAETGPYTRWIVANYPVTLGIAAAGAAMVSLIGHSLEPTTPAGTAWLLGGSVALALAGLMVVVHSLVDFERVSFVYRPALVALAAGAVVALVLAYAQPPAWLLALGLALDLLAVWLVAINRWLAVRGASTDALDDATT